MSIADTRPTHSRAALEAALLDLFAPAGARRPGDSSTCEATTLWRMDAIHRARNMAQLSSSLAALISHETGRWPVASAAAPARALARTYEELNVSSGGMSAVPCLAMLSEVATRLALIFGEARKIGVLVSGEDVAVAPEVRRVLILMASELVINALKYAYAPGRGGVIRVSLSDAAGVIALSVEDDGVSLGSPIVAGEGSSLLDRLAQTIGATLHRGPGADHAGLSVSVRVPKAQAIGPRSLA